MPISRRHFLLDIRFILRRDRAALTHLMRTPNPVAQPARYLDTLTEYEFSIQYQPGLSHRNADALSRRPYNRTPGFLVCRQCGPLLDPIAEKTITEELEDEEETPVKRVDSDSESEISEDWGIISLQSKEEEFTEIEKDCSIAKADPTPFSDEMRSTETGSQVFSARLTKTKEPREKQIVTRNDREKE